MKILLIGGSGFIGTRLGKRLLAKDNQSLFVLDKVPSSLNDCVQIRADITSPIDINIPFGSIEVLINLAAEHRDDVSPRSLYDDVNVEGARNVCNYARQKNISKLIFTSSVAVYGFTNDGADESARLNPLGDYGRTKLEAEHIYKQWLAEDPHVRTLVIVRPTVVFGEGNRGNVYNLLNQIASGRFLMIGDGFNKKSMAYVENVAAFLEYSIGFGPGLHIYNYVDKPDFSMNQLVAYVNNLLRTKQYTKFKLPFFIGLVVGLGFDFLSKLTCRKYAISAIRVRKFCSNSIYSSSITQGQFIAPVSLLEALEKTIKFEFSGLD
jgi:nucleoside-diphosphate-sugar epimerase